MKQTFIIGNWKANKTASEAKQWCDGFANQQFTNTDNKTIILCPPFTLLPLIKTWRDAYGLPFLLGAQDVSPYPAGSYTGEIAAAQLAEFVEYVIIGHSERRSNFHEDELLIVQKVKQATEQGLGSIVCISDIHMPIPPFTTIVAYEPLSAIGTGSPDTPENANSVAKAIKEVANVPTVIYGGSVTGENVRSFTQMEWLDGVLPGKASLRADTFATIVQNA